MKTRTLFSLALGFTLFSAATAAAQRRVTGRVTDSTGAPVAAVSVAVQGTSVIASTDAEGRYVLNNVPAGGQTLIARRIGYRRNVQTLAAGATEANFQMGHDPLQLEEIVVTGQATTVSTQNAANAVTIVSSAEVNR